MRAKYAIEIVAVLVLGLGAVTGFWLGHRGKVAGTTLQMQSEAQAIRGNTNPSSAESSPRTTRNGIPLLSPLEVNALRTRPDVLVIDVRGDFAWAQEHVPGAISFPEDQAEQRYNELPRDKLIIAY